MAWYLSDSRCGVCRYLPKEGWMIRKIVENEALFKITVLTKCPKCLTYGMRFLESRERLNVIVDEHKKDWLN